MHLARLYPGPTEPNTPQALPAAARHLRCLAAVADRRASLSPELHWAERLSWRLVAEEYRGMADRWEHEFQALQSERAALLARGAVLAEGSNTRMRKVRP
jgi:hypothetical protein